MLFQGEEWKEDRNLLAVNRVFVEHNRPTTYGALC